MFALYRDQQEVISGGPGHSVSLNKLVWLGGPELSRATGYQIVHAIEKTVLLLVFVATQDHLYSCLFEAFYKFAHFLGVMVLRSRAKRRVMAERNTPPWTLTRNCVWQCCFDEFLMLGMIKESFVKEVGLFGRVDANKFYVRAIAETVEQSRI